MLELQRITQSDFLKINVVSNLYLTLNDEKMHNGTLKHA